MNCRACGGELRLVLDLGEQPIANAFMPSASLARALERYPLRFCTCVACGFAQLDIAIAPEVLFADTAYETPRVAALEDHYDRLIRSLPYFPRRAIEMGSNNGAFLEKLQKKCPDVLGIEPSPRLAAEAKDRGVATHCGFFDATTATLFGKADLFVARHCMAHIDDLRGTLEAVASVLTDDGTALIENAYLGSTLNGGQFDQIYHEHMSYFALGPMKKLFRSVGLHLRHALVASIHGGSIVFFATKQPGPERVFSENGIAQLEAAEAKLDMSAFAFRARTTIAGIREGLTGVGVVDSYGATAKGNTLLNAVGGHEIRYAVDSTPAKQGRYTPGTGIKVISEVDAQDDRPDTYLLTAWNWEREIFAKNVDFRGAGGRWVVPMPYPRLV